jgi:hypothetical protein
MIPCEVRGGFFQELVLHPEFPCLAFQLLESFPLGDRQRWFLASMLTPICGYPVTERAFSYSVFTGYRGDRPGSVDHLFHGRLPELGRERSFLAWQ